MLTVRSGKGIGNVIFQMPAATLQAALVKIVAWRSYPLFYCNLDIYCVLIRLYGLGYSSVKFISPLNSNLPNAFLCIKILLLTSRFYMPAQSYPQVIHLFRRNLLINPFSPMVVFCYNEVGRSGELW